MRRREFISLIVGAGGLPLAALAQQKSLPVIGYLHFGQPGGPFQKAFLEGLKDTGYAVGQKLSSHWLVCAETRWSWGLIHS